MFRKAYNESWPWDHPLKMLIQTYYFILGQRFELFQGLLRKYHRKNFIFNKYHSQLLNYWIRSLSWRLYIKKSKISKNLIQSSSSNHDFFLTFQRSLNMSLFFMTKLNFFAFEWFGSDEKTESRNPKLSSIDI